MWHVPILRRGEQYESLDKVVLNDYATGEKVAEVSQANAGLISRDLMCDDWTGLQSCQTSHILGMFQAAAKHFMQDPLPVGDSEQTPEDYVAAQSATTGLPYTMCRQNMSKIENSLSRMEHVLRGLTGGLDLAALDAGYGYRDGIVVSYAPRARRFGAVLPANSPGVHALWLPALALRTPVALKPGQQEPWTPLRILEALRRADFPDSAFGYYPAGHDGAATILRRCDQNMLFGAGPTVRPWVGDPRVELHGPGFSKVLLGVDLVEEWADFLDLIETSVAANGGRSCINASGVWTPAHGRDLADALARRLAAVVPAPRDDDRARLAAFSDPNIAAIINQAIDRGLAQGGAEDISARYRGPDRLAHFEDGAYLLPTVIYCESPDHPLANREYLFPFVSVVEAPQDELLKRLGPSLVVTALTEDKIVERALMVRAEIGRLNLGPVPTTRIEWDQPHEGNLFERLYQQRAFKRELFPRERAVV
ncbi:MAG: aldehyde dehydrogenase family protein [Planctomycetota bacterium]|jgi:acyl-CoA reductase-like NAD-dependent aldehyde dehydrogenase